MQSLSDQAFNHIRLVRQALRQLFTSYYQNALELQEIEACQCEMELIPDQRCSHTAYGRYHEITTCPRHIQSVAVPGQSW